eukprot:gnl/Chilomastix_cuspidata/395.p2 GENE.gnl/Chilomastix_cuspidata/395~~gnl/Chilomastix_cuspidata/395.p2  ORF type:complete len:516 (+),score=270.52 gnl/Chilomastix_cuspidata/395:136-1683(+)
MGFPDELQVAFEKTYGQPVLKITPELGKPDHRKITVGAIFSGGQAPGGHNVISGLFDKLSALNPGNTLLGFRGGPDGLLKNDCFEITSDVIDLYRNMGGFDLLGSGRTKIDDETKFVACEQTVATRGLDVLIIIGGDDSNTNACVLAERFLRKGIPCSVIGVPKTIDRDLISKAGIETSFGFDSATKVYSVLIANICRDCLSAKKYWHFIRLMGRSASHITLECALQTCPNITLIGEEVAAKKMSLQACVKQCADVIQARMDAGKNFGVALVPEGLVEFIPGVGELIQKLSDVLATLGPAVAATPAQVAELLADDAEMCALFKYLPPGIQAQLLLDRDPHGNVQVSRIETEKLFTELIAKELAARDTTYRSRFSALTHFFGYEGRCVAPSNFDATYCYCLGMVAAILGTARRSGYMACCTGLALPPTQWTPCGIPITSLMTVERRHGKAVPVIEKQLVDLTGRPLRALLDSRDAWAAGEHYRNPGPIQYYSGADDEALRAISDRPTLSLMLENAE